MNSRLENVVTTQLIDAARAVAAPYDSHTRARLDSLEMGSCIPELTRLIIVLDARGRTDVTRAADLDGMITAVMGTHSIVGHIGAANSRELSDVCLRLAVGLCHLHDVAVDNESVALIMEGRHVEFTANGLVRYIMTLLQP